MKNLGNMISALGILVFIYSIAGRFIGAPTIGLCVIPLSASTGIIVGNGIMLIGIIINRWGK